MPPVYKLPPAPAALGRRARRKAELRERILRAAMDLFARQGFFSTTVEQITRAADVGKGTFFNYFPSKEHVLAGFGEFQLARIKAGLAEAQAGERPIHQVLRRLVKALSEEPGRSPALVRSLMLANLSSEPVRQLFRRKLMQSRRRLRRIFTLGQQRGEVRRDLQPARMARVFQQMFLGTILLWAAHPPSRLESWVEPAFEIFWSGIAAQRGVN